MFIDAGSFVRVKDIGGRMAGRYGVVEKIRIVSHSGAVIVFVAIYDFETGASPVMMFEAAELEKRRFSETSAKRITRCDASHKFVLEDLAEVVA